MSMVFFLRKIYFTMYDVHEVFRISIQSSKYLSSKPSTF